MGALFGLRIRQYDSFANYRAEHPTRCIRLCWMAPWRWGMRCAVRMPYALVFGNEGSGLDAAFATMGQAVRIPHSEAIDSLNLAVAVAIGAYAFAGRRQEV